MDVDKKMFTLNKKVSDSLKILSFTIKNSHIDKNIYKHYGEKAFFTII